MYNQGIEENSLLLIILYIWILKIYYLFDIKANEINNKLFLKMGKVMSVNTFTTSVFIIVYN